jgi:hypothetical protein
VAIGIGTEWWIGLATWLVLTALLWIGWIRTRELPESEGGLSPRAERLLEVSITVVSLALDVLIVMEAAIKWGEPGFLAALLGVGGWSFAMGHLSGKREEAEAPPVHGSA